MTIVEASSEWQAVRDYLARELEIPPAEDGFMTWRLRDYRLKVEAGDGIWGACRSRGEIVCTAGLFRAGEFLRFQEVVTHSAYRCRGIAQSLCHTLLSTCRKWPDRIPLAVAESGSPAEYLYRMLGFRLCGHQCSLMRRADKEQM